MTEPIVHVTRALESVPGVQRATGQDNAFERGRGPVSDG